MYFAHSTVQHTDDHDHHEYGVVGAEHGGEADLDLLPEALVADDEEEDGGQTGENEAAPHVDVGGGVEGVGDGDGDGGGREYVGGEEAEVVEDGEEADVLVEADGAPVVLEDLDGGGEGGGQPAAPLVEVLGDGLGRVRVRVRRGAVLDLVALLDEEPRQVSVGVLLK